MDDVSAPVAVTGYAGALTTVILVVGEVIKKLKAKKLAKAYADSEPAPPAHHAPPPPVFAPAPVAREPQHSQTTESQAQRARNLLIEAELLEVQTAMRRLRASLDDAALENARKTAALIEERGDKEELLARCKRQAEELVQLRADNERKTASLSEERQHNKKLLDDLAHMRREGGERGTDTGDRRSADPDRRVDRQPARGPAREVRPEADAVRGRTGRRQSE